MSPKSVVFLLVILYISCKTADSDSVVGFADEINICPNSTTAMDPLMLRVVNTVGKRKVRISFPKDLPPTAPKVISCIRVLKRDGFHGYGAKAAITSGGVGATTVQIVLRSGVLLKINYEVQIYTNTV